MRGEIQPRPLAWHRVDRALDLHQRAARGRHQPHRVRPEGVRGQRQHPPLLRGEALGDSAALGVAGHAGVLVEPGEQRPAHLGERLARRDGHEVLQPHALAARLDAALVVAGARPREAGLEEVVRRERLEARRELALRACEDARHRRAEVVVEEPLRHRAQMRERAHVPVEEADLVLAIVEPGEVAARVHQPQEEHPRLAARAPDVDEHLEEVGLGEVARPVDQRHEDLLPLPLPLGDELLDERGADVAPLGDEQAMELRRGEPLLTTRPPRRLGEEHLEARPHRLERRPPPCGRLAPARLGALNVAAHRVAREAELPRHLPHRNALHQDLVSCDVDLIHPKHPPAEAPAPQPGKLPGGIGGSVSERRMDQFQSGGISGSAKWERKAGDPSPAAAPIITRYI